MNFPSKRTLLCLCVIFLPLANTVAYADEVHGKCIISSFGKNNSPQCRKIYNRINFSKKINSSESISKINFSSGNCIKIKNAGIDDYCGFMMLATHSNLLKFLMNSNSVSFGSNMFGGTSCAAPSVINNGEQYKKNGVNNYHIVCYRQFSEIPLKAIENIGKKNRFNNASFLNATEISELFKNKNYLFSGYIEEKIGGKLIVAQVCSSHDSCSGTIPQPALLSFHPIVLEKNGNPKIDDGMDIFYTGLLPLGLVGKSITNANGKDSVYLNDSTYKGRKKIIYTSQKHKIRLWLENPSIWTVKTKYSNYYHTDINIRNEAGFKLLTKSGGWVYVFPGISSNRSDLNLFEIEAPKTDSSVLTVLKKLPNPKSYDCSASKGLKDWTQKIRTGYNTVCGIVTKSSKNTITLINNEQRNSTYPSNLLFAMQESGKCSFKKAEKLEKRESIVLCSRTHQNHA